MKAFLLSTDPGTRLHPLADQTPKFLQPACGKSPLHQWLENLEKHGINEVLVNTRLPHEKIDVSQRHWTGGRTKISIFHEPGHLGNAGVILANKNWAAGPNPFLILNGDKVSNANLGKMISFHCRHGYPLTLGVVRTKAPGGGGIEAGEDGIITALAAKPGRPRSDLAAAGVYIADHRIFDFFPEQKPLEFGPLDLGLHVIPNMVGNAKIYFIQDFSLDAGTSSAYEAAHALWKERSNDP
jgi:NDP-sugar pyrophosphorylase family protein